MENENKDALEERLTAVSFAIYDTVLYLDAYPESARALAYLSNLRREKARKNPPKRKKHGTMWSCRKATCC